MVYNDSQGNPTTCCHVPFNVQKFQKFKISGSSHDSGHFFLPGNSVKGRISVGALAVVSTTGNIRVEGLGDLEPNKVYKFVVFRNGENRNWNIDWPWITVQGTADIWIIEPWVVPGSFADAPGENKRCPLFVAPNSAYYTADTKVGGRK